ncbi:MAG: hypothetical protein HY714_05575, partial [Candidatus Omnitrophica bacterium]|nr:hypothetical protein [Candidatus Omnitrophota bacterium]
NMRDYRRFLTLCLAWILLLAGGEFRVLGAQDETDEGVKKFGTVHNIAEDRKIEKIGGLYEPEGLDKYMKRLFEGVNARMDALEGQVSRVEKQLQEIHALLKSSSGEKQTSR